MKISGGSPLKGMGEGKERDPPRYFVQGPRVPSYATEFIIIIIIIIRVYIAFSRKTQYTPPTPTRRNCRVEPRRRCERTRRQS